MATVHLRAVVDMLQCSVPDRAVGMVPLQGKSLGERNLGGWFQRIPCLSMGVLSMGHDGSHLYWLASIRYTSLESILSVFHV